MRRVLTAVFVCGMAFLITWALFHCWPQAQAILSWEAWGIQFGAFGPIAVFFMSLLIFLRAFWKPIAGLEGPPPGPKYPPQNPVPPIVDRGTGPAAERLREGQRLYFRGYQFLAIEKYMEAMQLADEERNVKQRAHAQLGSAHCYSLLGEHSVSRAYYEEARKLYQQLQDRLGEANVLRGLGDLELTLGQNEAARRCYEEARKLYDSMGMKVESSQIDSLDEPANVSG